MKSNKSKKKSDFDILKELYPKLKRNRISETLNSELIKLIKANKKDFVNSYFELIKSRTSRVNIPKIKKRDIELKDWPLFQSDDSEEENDLFDEDEPNFFDEGAFSCEPLFVNWIFDKDCIPKTRKITKCCKGKICALIFPGSNWENNVDLAINEIRRAQRFYAQYCIDLTFQQARITNRRLVSRLNRWYNNWYSQVVQAIGGEDKLGTTTIPPNLLRQYLSMMRNIQRAVRGCKLLIVFVDEYVGFTPRMSLVSSNQERFQQIGINWVDSGSHNILSHELIHALGKPSPAGKGQYTWVHQSNCSNSLSKVTRSSSRVIENFERKYLDIAEYLEIINNKGGNVISCEKC